VSLIRNIKAVAGKVALKKVREPERVRKGSNFTNAERIAFVYIDSDETFFKQIKNFTRQLKTDYNIRNVMALGFIDSKAKDIPVWQNQKLEFEYFTREDLNWKMKPGSRVRKFVEEDFDILIDLTDGKSLPLNFVIRESRACMKVGRKGSRVEKVYDLIFDMGQKDALDSYLDQLKKYLSKPQIQ
jgi:hypothetical protein